MKQFGTIIQSLFSTLLSLSWIWVVGYFLIQQYQQTPEVMSFFHEYTRYFILLWISVVAYYLLRLYRHKKRTIYLSRLIIGFHLYAATWYYFTQIMETSHTIPLIVLWCTVICLILVASNKEKTRMIVWVMITICLLIVGFALIPTYTKPVNLSSFFTNRNTLLIINNSDSTTVNNENNIHVSYTTSQWTTTIRSDQLTTQELTLRDELIAVSLSSHTRSISSSVSVVLRDGTVITLLPQTILTVANTQPTRNNLLSVQPSFSLTSWWSAHIASLRTHTSFLTWTMRAISPDIEQRAALIHDNYRNDYEQFIEQFIAREASYQNKLEIIVAIKHHILAFLDPLTYDQPLQNFQHYRYLFGHTTNQPIDPLLTVIGPIQSNEETHLTPTEPLNTKQFNQQVDFSLGQTRYLNRFWSSQKNK